ncbi:hypothetical protein GCM10009758_21980 [Microbacterium hatanonis]
MTLANQTDAADETASRPQSHRQSYQITFAHPPTLADGARCGPDPSEGWGRSAARNRWGGAGGVANGGVLTGG